MISFKILHLEDEQENITNFQRTITRYNKQHSYNIQYEAVLTLEDFNQKNINEYDATIIDIKLNGNPDEGYTVLNNMQKALERIPSVIYTGTDSQNDNKYALKTFTKGDDNVDEEILDFLVSIYKTGLMNLLGGKGQIEQILSDIYNSNIRYNMEEWLNLAVQDSSKTETALLRFISHCLEDMLHTDCEQTYSVEMYISPLLNEELSPGLIIQDNHDNKFIVITPACDLALHNGTRKADSIQLCCIENITKHFPGTSQSAKNRRKCALENKNNMFHCLPKCKIFEGGLINFQGLKMIEIAELENGNYKSVAKIASPYLKNILARFSNYYARQGQPDISWDIDAIEQELAGQSGIN